MICFKKFDLKSPLFQPTLLTQYFTSFNQPPTNIGMARLTEFKLNYDE